MIVNENELVIKSLAKNSVLFSRGVFAAILSIFSKKSRSKTAYAVH